MHVCPCGYSGNFGVMVMVAHLHVFLPRALIRVPQLMYIHTFMDASYSAALSGRRVRAVYYLL